MNIHLLHTNDIHSSIENHIRLGHLLRGMRQRLQSNGEPVLTVDLGDVLDRVRPETEVTRGLINASLMRALGYDAWVFGNNEGLTIPKEAWETLVSASHAAFLTTNLRHEDGRPFTFGVDWIMRKYADVTVGLLGITENFERPYRVLGVRVLNPIEAAGRLSMELRNMGCDIVVVLSHLGLWRDRQLAEAVDGIDVILGGHSHNFMDQPEWVQGTAIFQAGKHALAFGHTCIAYDEQTRRIRSIHCARIDVNTHGLLDGPMLTVYQDQQEEMEERLEQVIFSLQSPLPVELNRESPFANVLVDSLYHAYDCDLGIMMSGALTASLLAGDIQVRHVLGACSTPTRPVRLTLQGSDIVSILHKAIQPDWYYRQGIGYGFRGSVVGYLSLANMRVELDGTVNGQPVIKRVEIGGDTLSAQRSYRVVTCEFLWLSPVFEEFQRGADVQFERPLVREILLDYLQSQAPNQLCPTPRYG